mmetsp:Transcript_18102/g.55414  ORF Transcript_18102/g.55414 Transcript_18102/m.55414 type:complete len:264 (+) Transcript_18102:91-882(+)
MAVVALDGGWIEAAIREELDEFQSVVAAVLGHHEVVARAVDDVEEVRELVDGEAEEVAVREGLAARIGESPTAALATAVLLDGVDVEEELLSDEAADDVGLKEERDLGGVVAEAPVAADVVQDEGAFLDEPASLLRVVGESVMEEGHVRGDSGMPRDVADAHEVEAGRDALPSHDVLHGGCHGSLVAISRRAEHLSGEVRVDADGLGLDLRLALSLDDSLARRLLARDPRSVVVRDSHASSPTFFFSCKIVSSSDERGCFFFF